MQSTFSVLCIRYHVSGNLGERVSGMGSRERPFRIVTRRTWRYAYLSVGVCCLQFVVINCTSAEVPKERIVLQPTSLIVLVRKEEMRGTRSLLCTRRLWIKTSQESYKHTYIRIPRLAQLLLVKIRYVTGVLMQGQLKFSVTLCVRDCGFILYFSAWTAYMLILPEPEYTNTVFPNTAHHLQCFLDRFASGWGHELWARFYSCNWLSCKARESESNNTFVTL